MKRADCSLGVTGILSCVAPLAFQMPVVVFKRFQNIRTGLLIGNAGGNVLSYFRVLDVDFLFLIRLFLAHDGFYNPFLLRWRAVDKNIAIVRTQYFAVVAAFPTPPFSFAMIFSLPLTIRCHCFYLLYNKD